MCRGPPVACIVFNIDNDKDPNDQPNQLSEGMQENDSAKNHRNMDLICRVQRLLNQNRETALAKCRTVIHQDVTQLQEKKTK